MICTSFVVLFWLDKEPAQINLRSPSQAWSKVEDCGNLSKWIATVDVDTLAAFQQTMTALEKAVIVADWWQLQ